MRLFVRGKCMTTATPRIRAAGAGLHRLRILVRGTAGNTTRLTLLRLTAALLVVTVIVFATSLLAFVRIRGTVATIRVRSVPAVVQITVARVALIRADNVATGNLGTNDVQLSGPGQEFWNQIAIAGQSLTQVAESNVAGESGRSDIQLAEGLVVTYTGMISQADAHFRQSGGTTLRTMDLWNASRLLHETILEQLDSLLKKQKEALDDQVAASSPTPGAVLMLLLPVICAATLLVGAQIMLWRRFRRRVNPWLVLATLLLLALSAISAADLLAQRRLMESRNVLYSLAPGWQAQLFTQDQRAQQKLSKLVRGTCTDPTKCGGTFERYSVGVEKLVSTARAPGDGQLATEARRANERAAAAGAYAGLESLIYILAVLIAGSVLLGFGPRLSEYRYRSR
jgi:hypothetical protein